MDNEANALVKAIAVERIAWAGEVKIARNASAAYKADHPHQTAAGIRPKIQKSALCTLPANVKLTCDQYLAAFLRMQEG